MYMNLRIKPLLRGLSTYIPWIGQRFVRTTGGTDSARYCYSVWLRHLVMAGKNGLNPCPKTVAELGPGDSLGIGLAALISGCERYYAFDVVAYADPERNLQIFDELVTLFKNKTDIPDQREFPLVKPYLDHYDFPSHLLTDDRLEQALIPSRLKNIREAVCRSPHSDSILQYRIPWYDTNVLEKASVDLVYSQAVLEHVEDLKRVYRAMYLWLKPGGIMSHVIDFSCHGLANHWNGHWGYSDFIWSLIKGKRLYLINREPHSVHLSLLKQAGFRIVCDLKNQSQSGLERQRLASRFQKISDDDLETETAFIQAVKI